jgi:phage-related protein
LRNHEDFAVDALLVFEAIEIPEIEEIYVILDIMSEMTYIRVMDRKPLAWLKGEVRTPPFSSDARLEAGFLLGLLQKGHKLKMPQSRPMPSIGKSCHELRVTDQDKIWRIIYRLDADAVVIGDVFCKKTESTPTTVIDNSKTRFKQYDAVRRKI